MEFRYSRAKLGVLITAIVALSLFGGYFYGRATVTPKDASQTISFLRPVFAQNVAATTSFLDQEAGMALYLGTNSPISLYPQANSTFSTIENATSDYILGSMSLPNLPHGDDPHCFVHKDGWIVIYYLKDEGASKVIDWQHYTFQTNELVSDKLKAGLNKMCDAISVSDRSQAQYYNFQYPTATKWMIIIKSELGYAPVSFNVSIPLEVTVYERTWSHYSGYSSGFYVSYFKIDSTTIDTITENGPHTNIGTLSLAQLSQGTNVFHTIGISGGWEPGPYAQGVCISLIYK